MARAATERQMAADYGVAVGPCAKALALLEEKGVLNGSGSGNYVRPARQCFEVYSHFRLEKPGGGGCRRADRVPSRTRIHRASAGLQAFSTTHSDRRLRSLDGHLVAPERIWLDAILGRLADRVVVSGLSIAFYRDHLGLVIFAGRRQCWCV